MNHTNNSTNIGFGCQAFEIGVYIANRPNMLEYQDIDTIVPLTGNEIYTIGQACGNGWRKVFNVYAKFIFALNKKAFSHLQQGATWQVFRDKHLLQSNSKTALLFSPPKITADSNTIHIICGRTYAKELRTYAKELRTYSKDSINSGKLDSQLTWLNEEFAVDQSQRLIVCPYFDYRQLSNVKIDYLCELIDQLIINS